jgi:hypothetical protein
VKVGEAEIIALPTGGKPDLALAAYAARWAGTARVYNLSVAHDDDCPCAAGDLPVGQCTCEIVEVVARRVT